MLSEEGGRALAAECPEGEETVRAVHYPLWGNYSCGGALKPSKYNSVHLI